jgi:preprotein translocase subunit SecD
MKKFILFLCFLFSIQLLSAQELLTGCYYVIEKSDSTILATGKKDTVYVDKNPIITISDFDKIKLKKTNYSYVLEIDLKRAAVEKFRIATAAWVHKKMALIVEGEVISAPIVNSEIANGKVWLTNGTYIKEEMNAMKEKLEKEIKAFKK